MKNIPNTITSCRILASICLSLVKPFSPLFYFLYLICGASDILDGHIARKFKLSSKSGQVMDSIADLLFIAIFLLKVIPIIDIPPRIIYWIAVIAAIRLISLIVGYIRFNQFAFLHTWANKATGLFLFAFPILFPLLGKKLALTTICCIAIISATEELLINLSSKTLDRNRISIFSK
ncbi:CDP-alcohol phosphatidyltransferase family protein [Liquorilactobacillus uvarum]|uniref:CDP-alcohol phosphatidyltransferase family protein n=1 Tax=Liquorilactobacillus uvarum TaxID=303240 RepID=UPI0035CF95DE